MFPMTLKSIYNVWSNLSSFSFCVIRLKNICTCINLLERTIVWFLLLVRLNCNLIVLSLKFCAKVVDSVVSYSCESRNPFEIPKENTERQLKRLLAKTRGTVSNLLIHTSYAYAILIRKELLLSGEQYCYYITDSWQFSDLVGSKKYQIPFLIEFIPLVLWRRSWLKTTASVNCQPCYVGCFSWTVVFSVACGTSQQFH